MTETPEDLFYSESHEWVRADGPDVVIGITDFAQHSLTDVVYVELPKVGAKLSRGKSFGVVESVKSVSELFSPMDGQVVAVNDELTKRPEMINDDPYGKGWMLRVKPAGAGYRAGLLSADAYRKTTGE